ncbi:hypothetical protein FUAX_23940 [Fulvitalea axinellae]|uniref:FAS1 domain-containing protein n=1 Tax=Fulvitalea axinellae TaxID=1182444 RepID=A0AAU9CSM3_9BACT|nr:hypothetical protein FUAX_23940 [Fulvitalea axinellae]
MKTDFQRILGLVLAVALMAYSCDDKDEYIDGGKSDQVKAMTVGEYLASVPEYAYFSDLLKKHSYTDSVSGSRPVTVFLPSKEAIQSLAVSEDSMKSILSYHIGNTLLYPHLLSDDKDQYLKTLYSGKNVWVSKQAGGGLSLDRSVASSGKPVLCSNGIVHTIDGMLEPQKNLFESIQSKSDLFSEYKKVVLKDTLLFDLENSFPVGVDQFGRQVYDSAFVLGYIFLGQLGNISDEDQRYSSVLLSDAALQATYDRMVERYYSSEENLPDYFSEEDFQEELRTQILLASVIKEPTEEKTLGDTLETTNGKKILVTQEWLDYTPERRSNGLLYEVPKVDLLMSNWMGRPIEFDAGLGVNLTKGLIGVPNSGEEVTSDPVSNEAINELALHFSSSQPFWVEYSVPELMGGLYELRLSGLKVKSTQAKVFVDGNEIDPRYTPSGNWNFDRFEGLGFGAFGEKVVRFEVTESTMKDNPDNPEELVEVYEFAVNKLTFVPVAE